MIDLQTVFTVEMVIIAFMTLVMVIMRQTQRTYAGYPFWIWCNVSLLAAYAVYFWEQGAPNVLLASLPAGLGILSTVFRLEGVKAFLGRETWHPNFFLPVLAAIINLVFLTHWPDSLWRSTVYAVFVALPLLRVTWLLHPAAKGKNRKLYRFCAWLFFGMAIVILIRVGVRFVNPAEQAGFAQTPFNIAFFLCSMLFDIGWTTLFLLMNGHRLTSELEEQSEELTKALTEIRALDGILPICSYCKNIRDDEGYWKQLEVFISERSEARFSHSVCPDCLRRHFPDLDGLGDEQDADLGDGD